MFSSPRTGGAPARRVHRQSLSAQYYEVIESTGHWTVEDTGPSARGDGGHGSMPAATSYDDPATVSTR